MSSLAEINKEIRILNNGIDGISDDLVKSLEKYQNEYERLLRKERFDLDAGNLKRTSKNFAKAQTINPMNKLGFNEIAISHIDEYDSIAKDSLGYLGKINIETDLDFTDITVLKQLKKIYLANILGEGETLDLLVKKELVNSIALNADYQDVIDNLSEQLLGSGEKTGRLVRYADTYVRTSAFGLSRMIDKEIFDDLKVKEFLYVGPFDKRTRDFCKKHIGKIYTRKQIAKFPDQNKSGLDPYFSPGGWNCRHRLVPADILSV